MIRDREVAGSNPVAPTIFRNEPFGENVEGLSHCGDQSYSPEYGRGNQTACAQRRKCTPMTTRSFALARLRRHREAFLDPRLPQRRLAGDGSGRLIAVKV